MTWTKLSDDFTDRPAMLRVSRDARLLHIEAMVWCNRMLTDGMLPAAAVRRLTDSPDPDAAVVELVDAELWDPVDDPVGWQLDWSDQEDGSDVRKRREATAERQRRFRRRKELHDRGDHTECDPTRCPALRRVTRDVTRYETPSRPVPSRPVPTDREGQGPGAARTRSASAPHAGDLSDQATPPPHDFTPHRDDPNPEEPTYPCDRCHKVLNHIAHKAHLFDSDSEDPTTCSDCGFARTAGVHHYAISYGQNWPA
jgi:hypothetical protein